MEADVPRHTRVSDYLLAIRKLSQNREYVPTGLIASEIGVSNGTASSKLQELARRGLVDLRSYSGVKLTPEGIAIALITRRRQQLIELFLLQTLQLPQVTVIQQAWAIEILISESTLSAIDAFLGKPSRDICGEAILV